MGNEKWKAGVAIAAASSATDEPTPKHYLVCESANIELAPKVYTRPANYTPDVTHVTTAGFDYTFKADGITPDPALAGYLLWLMFGGDAYASSVHTLTPADDTPYLNFFVDRLEEIESGLSVERAIGAKLTGLTIDFPEEDYAKWAIEGVACNKGTALASLTPSIPTGGDNEPAAWKHLQAGDFQIGVNGGSVAQDNEVKGVKISLRRPPILSGQNLGNTQPTKVGHGMRDLTYELIKEFEGTNAKAQATAFRAHQSLELQMRATVGVNYLDLAIPFAKFNGNSFGDVGAGEDIVMFTGAMKAFKPEAAALITALVKDGTTALYT